MVKINIKSRDNFASVAGLVIGLALAFVHIIGILLTGTSVNLARRLGPAIFVGGEALSQVWVFIAALVWKAIDTVKSGEQA